MTMHRSIRSYSPGRINLIGEHTDYNSGFVLPAAINLGCTCDIKTNDTDNLNIWASDIDSFFSSTIGSLEKIEEFPTWFKYFYGVFMEIKKINPSIKGVDLHFSSTVPIGAGLSSSAAMTCSFAIGLNKLFSLEIPKIELILIAQQAEHKYVGILCGIMDQFASTFSKADHAIFLDCKTLDYSTIPCQLGDYEIVLVNSMVSHELAASEYNDRRKSCENALEKLQKFQADITSFRDLDINRLESFRNDLSLVEYKRAQHVIQENNRVELAVKALMEEDIKTLGTLIYKSHESLDQLYEVSCMELNLLVDLTKNLEFVIGSRMMGGGFGGCTLNIVHKDYRLPFINLISQSYKQKTGIVPKTYCLLLSDGGSIIRDN